MRGGDEKERKRRKGKGEGARSAPDGAGRRGKGGEGAKRAWGVPERVKILQNQDYLCRRFEHFSK